MNEGNVLTMEQWFPEGHMYPDTMGVDGAGLWNDLQKALGVSGTMPRIGLTGLDALGIEDLSGLMASAEVEEEQLHFWRDIPKEPAYDTVKQWTRLDSFGGSGATGFIQMGDNGVITDPVFARLSKEVKFMAVKGSLYLTAQVTRLVGMHGNIGQTGMETSEETKMMELLILAEQALFYGNSALDITQWDGVIKQIDDAATVQNQIRMDLRGRAPDKYFLERLVQIMANNAANPTHLYLPNQGMRDLRQSLFPETRLGEGSRVGRIGQDFNEYLIQEINADPGRFQLRRTQTLTRGARGGLPLYEPTTALGTAPTAPSTVTGVAAALSALPYRPGLAGDTYFYSVAAVGKGGRTAATASSGVVATDAQKITITINDADANVQFYEIWRNKAGTDGSISTNRLFLGRCARTGSATTFVDDGYTIPGTYDMLLLRLGLRDILFAQLLPVVKRVLPQTLTANDYGIMLFGTPVVKTPTKNVHIVNCGERPQDGIASI
jgi:hypothetical protein